MWYILAPLKALCLDCFIEGGCRESDPRCLYQQALAAGVVPQRKASLCEIQVLDYLRKHPGIWFRLKEAVNAVSASRSTVTKVVHRLAARGQLEINREGRALWLRSKDGNNDGA